jgi:hypothetical protein
MVAEMEQAMRAADPRAIVCIVSDHGFAATTKETHLKRAVAPTLARLMRVSLPTADPEPLDVLQGAPRR